MDANRFGAAVDLARGLCEIRRFRQHGPDEADQIVDRLKRQGGAGDDVFDPPLELAAAGQAAGVELEDEGARAWQRPKRLALRTGRFECHARQNIASGARNPDACLMDF